jgi:hypothetical protein
MVVLVQSIGLMRAAAPTGDDQPAAGGPAESGRIPVNS